MTTIIKSVNDTTVSVLTTVGTVAQQMSNTVNTAAKSLDMLDMFVDDLHHKQKQRSIAQRTTYHDELMEESAMEAAERQAVILKKLGKTPDLIALYESNLKKLADAFEAAKPKE